MNILIITDFFPPQQNIASFRMEAFAKFISKKDDKIYVFTIGEEDIIKRVDNAEVHYLSEPFSIGKFNFKKGESKILHYVKAGLNVGFSQVLVDKHILWRKKTIKEITKFAHTHNIDVIISSYGDATPHIIALNLKKRGIKFKWIADMRDEMSQRPGLKGLARMLLYKLERRVLKQADLITSVSMPLIESFRITEPNNQYLEIRNGYDYKEVHKSCFQDIFTFMYTGNFYGKIKPDNFFQAIVELINENKLSENIKIKIIGNNAPINIPKKLSSIIEEYPQVDHSEAIKELQNADVLLVIHPSNRRGVFTGKIFDYLPSNKIILSLTDPHDVIGKLLKETNSGFSVANEDIEGIKKSILNCYQLWENKIILPRNWTAIRDNSRQKQISKLSDYIINNLT